MARTVVTYDAGTYDVAGVAPAGNPVTVTDATLSTSDITTNNVSTSKHGFAPKAPNDATKYLDGSGAYSVPAGSGGGGITTYDYVTNSTVLTVNATTAAGADTFITGNAVTYDGSTLIRVECFSPLCASSAFIMVSVWDGSTDLGSFFQQNGVVVPVYGSMFFMPSAGSHTVTIKAWRGAGTASINPAGGGAGTRIPAWLRITKA